MSTRTCTIAFISAGLVLGLASTATAGLRPLYGGELVLRVAEQPVTLDPALAWTPAEVLVAGAVSQSLAGLSSKVVAVGNPVSELRFTLADGVANRVAPQLAAALDRSPVALPPMAFTADGHDLVVSLPTTLPIARDAIHWTWLRLPPIDEPVPFSFGRKSLDAQRGARRPLIDRIRLETKPGKPTPAGAQEFVLGAAGPGGRAVVALPRPGAAGTDAIRAMLGGLDRASLARLFVRGPTTVPPDLFSGPSQPSKPGVTLVVAVEEGEKDLKTIAQKLQLALRDRRITAKVVAESRTVHRERVLRGEFDLALVALPPAPEAVQAATLLRLAGPARSSALVWTLVADAGAAPLARAIERLGARLLYVEGGGIEAGRQVRGLSWTMPWEADLGSLWLVPRDLLP